MNDISLADVTIHVDENLSAEQRQGVEAGLRAIDGVVSVRNADARPHLLLVEYNPARTDSASLLASVTGPGYHAEIIGL